MLSPRFFVLLILVSLHFSCRQTTNQAVNDKNGDNLSADTTMLEEDLSDYKLDTILSQQQDTSLVKTEEGKISDAEDSQETEKEIPVVPENPTQETEKITNPVKKKSPPQRPAISFKELEHNFGEIVEGDIIKHNFLFKNTGNAGLEIKSVDVSCGCTFPSFPFLPIEPGDTGYIGVTYKSKGKSGAQKPYLTVKTNVRNEEIILYLKGFVKDRLEEQDSKTDSLQN